MTEAVARISRIISDVHLVGVRMVSVRAETRISAPDEIQGTPEITFRHQATASDRDEEGRFLVVAGIRTRIASSQEPKEPLVSIDAGFELQYELPTVIEASKADLKVFADINGIFNAWPYFRELIQSTTERMCLPPLVLPLFRLPGSRGESAGPKRKPARRKPPRSEA